MKTRAIIPLAVGLLVGILALKIFGDVLRKARGASSANQAVNMIYAAADIPPTAEIRDSMIESRSIPRSLAPKAVFTDAKEVVGRVSSTTIPKGMPIVPTLLAPVGTPPGLAVRIRDGYRAVAVQIDESAGVAGWIKPGSRVDVVAVMQVDTGSGQNGTISKVILENAEVLAVGQDIGSSGDVSASVTKSVTLGVLPEDVPKLHLASTRGKVRLAMRNQRDDTIARSQTTDKELLGLPSDRDKDGQGGASGPAGAFLASLLNKQPKMPARKTDKDLEASQAGPSAPAKADASSRDKVWRVEVLAGPKVEEIWFDDSTSDAHRLGAKSEDRSGARAAEPAQHKGPVTAAPVNGDVVTGSAKSCRLMESKE